MWPLGKEPNAGCRCRGVGSGWAGERGAVPFVAQRVWVAPRQAAADRRERGGCRSAACEMRVVVLHVQGTVSMRTTTIPPPCASSLRAKAPARASEDPATSPAEGEACLPPAMSLTGTMSAQEGPSMGAAGRPPVFSRLAFTIGGPSVSCVRRQLGPVY